MQITYEYFGAFYAISEVIDGQPVLYGTRRREAFQCAPSIWYIRLAKDLSDALLNVDLKGEFICDFTLASADSQALAMGYMMTGAKEGFHPITQAILAQDEANGMDRETILATRAGIMTAEFRGFVPDHVFMSHPELAGTRTIETESGPVEDPIFKPCDWYLTDNPEFL